MKNIRNFSIIAHIDHGKSTLSDRIIQICGGLSDCEIGTQVLDSMILERERGITIKAQSVMLNYKSLDDNTYRLNLIDTPGHVDFSYEVSRSLAASEGALLIIDASQGIESQTIANFRTAIEMDLQIIPILNKIDLLNTYPNSLIKEIKNIIGIDASKVICCSAKTGIGVIDVLERVVYSIPPPKGDPNAPLQALVIDSWFDNYFGVISVIRIKNGTLRRGDKIKIMSTGQIYNADRVGVFTPKQYDLTELKCGEVGWLICVIKDISVTLVGDTITGANNPANQVLPSFKKTKSQVFAGLFPINSNEYIAFRDALGKLSLNDSSLFYEPEYSYTLGLGFRCGFLGLLHMEIVKERLEREYNLSLIVTAPNVVYELEMKDKEIIYIDNPSKLPPMNSINELREPIATCHILLPKEYLGKIIELCVKKRGIQINMVFYDKQVSLTYEIPMAEIVLGFFNQMKSVSRGYASLDYNFTRFQTAKIVCINILINNEHIDGLSFFAHKDNAIHRSRELVEKIKNFIPRQQFNIVIQAAINKQVIASSVVKQLRKDVLTKCHGGDVSRKQKLLKKQKEGKKRMKQIGNFLLPQEVFLTILNIDKENK